MFLSKNNLITFKLVLDAFPEYIPGSPIHKGCLKLKGNGFTFKDLSTAASLIVP